MEKFNVDASIKNMDFQQDQQPWPENEVKALSDFFYILMQEDQRIKKEQKKYGNQSK
jgi:hypothetical protein